MSREYATHLALVTPKNTTTVEFIAQLRKAWSTLPDLAHMVESSLFNPTDWLANFFTVDDSFRVKVFFNTIYWNRYSDVNYDLMKLFEAARPFLLGYNIMLVGEDAGESERSASDTVNFYEEVPEFAEVYEKLPVDLQVLADWCLDLQFGSWNFELETGYPAKYKNHKPAAPRARTTGNGWPYPLTSLKQFQLVGMPKYFAGELVAFGKLDNKQICVTLNRASDPVPSKCAKFLVICYDNSSVAVTVQAASELLNRVSPTENPDLHALLTKALAETL